MARGENERCLWFGGFGWPLEKTGFLETYPCAVAHCFARNHACPLAGVDARRNRKFQGWIRQFPVRTIGFTYPPQNSIFQEAQTHPFRTASTKHTRQPAPPHQPRNRMCCQWRVTAARGQPQHSASGKSTRSYTCVFKPKSWTKPATSGWHDPCLRKTVPFKTAKPAGFLPPHPSLLPFSPHISHKDVIDSLIYLSLLCVVQTRENMRVRTSCLSWACQA